MLLVEGVSFAYPQGKVLEEINLTCEPGRMVGVVGRSGTGKTTLLNLIIGYLRPDSGRVMIDGRPPAFAARNQRLGLVQQGGTGLLPYLTVYQNVAMPLVIGRRVLGTGWLSPDDRRRVDRALERARIAHAAHLHPGELSAGMAARAMIARAIVHEPNTILFDEALAPLDDVVSEALYGEIQHLLAETCFTGVLVSHRLSEVILLCDRVVVLCRDAVDRPSRVALIEDLPFGRPRTPSLYGEQRFAAARARLRSALG